MADLPDFVRDHAHGLIERMLMRADAKFVSYNNMLEAYDRGAAVSLPRGPLPLMAKRSEAELDLMALHALLELLDAARPEHEKALIAACDNLPRTRSGAQVLA